MNIKRSPVKDAAILPGGHGNNPQPGVIAQKLVAKLWPLGRVIQLDHQQIRRELAHALRDVCFVGYFSDDLDARLVAQRCKNQLPHKLRAISHKNTNQTGHGSAYPSVRLSIQETEKK